MSKRILVAELPEFDATHYLESETSIAAYLTDILQANDAALLASALGEIARARGMTEIAKAAGLTREALYKALRPDSSPRFDTVSRVCAALGIRLVAQTSTLAATRRRPAASVQRVLNPRVRTARATATK